MILNIGLEKVTQAKAIGSLASMGVVIDPMVIPKVYDSHSEPTLVLQCDASPREVYRLAVHLGEDCIAAWDEVEGVGYLEGPKAHEWGGSFNPAYFLQLNGEYAA